MSQEFLACLDRLCAPSPDNELAFRPIFMVGAPRSGSTLAMQLMTDAFDLGYLANAHGQWYGAPALAERVLRPLAGRPPSNYESDLGRTYGTYAPSECGSWWYRFFRRHPPYVELHEVDLRKMRQFRMSIAALCSAFQRPVVFKNMYATLRIQAIAHHVPESLFVVVHREEVDNAHSILEARYEQAGNYNAWFSVEPPGVERLKLLPPQEQVVEQIRQIHKTMERDFQRAAVSAERVFRLHYESMCDDSHATLDQLAQFFESNNCQVARRGTPPRSFPRRSEVRVDQLLFNDLQSYSRAK